MQNIWYLVCISVWITSGYADITDEQVTHFKDEILVAISHLSQNMNFQFYNVNKKVDKLQKKFENMEGQLRSIEVSADAANEKASFILPDVNKIVNSVGDITGSIDSIGNELKEQENKTMNNFEGMNFTLHSLESDLNEVKLLRKNIRLIKKKQDLRMRSHFERVNITLSSLELKLEGVFENISLIEKEQERKIVNNFQNVNGEIGSVKNKLLKLLKIQKKLPRPRSCSDIYNQGSQTSETEEIFSNIGHLDDSVSVICDHVSDGGRWTVIQRRQDVQPRENFTRPWTDYVQGFGQLDGEFWVGLNVIQELTHQGSQELHISLEDWEGNKRHAKYSHFSVGPPEDNYRLKVTGYCGDAGDAMAFHNGQAFTTYDQDNDAEYGSNCAERFKGGWWYKNCHYANLNGRPERAQQTAFGTGINWYQWKGHNYSLRNVTMKIRPTN